jgi:DNA-directed RNA polymerase subunit RPC12/RpoP
MGLSVLCSSCGKQFSWERPTDTVAIIRQANVQQDESDRVYIVSCPYCRVQLSIEVSDK